MTIASKDKVLFLKILDMLSNQLLSKDVKCNNLLPIRK